MDETAAVSRERAGDDLPRAPVEDVVVRRVKKTGATQRGFDPFLRAADALRGAEFRA